MHEVSVMRKFLEPEIYTAKKIGSNDFVIDFEYLKKIILETKPNLLILGFSSYPKSYEFGDICEFAHKHEVLVLADIAHINGLVATNLHDSPFKQGARGADFISMTTHKTFRGPRAAMLFSKKYLPTWANRQLEAFPKNTKGEPVTSLTEVINRSIFPGGFGGPHFNKIAAIGQACLEILGEDFHPDNRSFTDYSKDCLKNVKALENTLRENDLEIVSPTQNHLCLVKLPKEKDSLEIQKKLESIGIISNRNVIPFDLKSAWKPSGLRLGSPAMTSRGLIEKDFITMGEIITDCIFDRKNSDLLKSKTQEMAKKSHWWY